jgi:hypothetical protein
MPRKPPPPHPKGTPRTPGSGRRKGTQNKKTVALRELMAALSGDVFYQEKLRQDFSKRRVHPSVELRVWEYALGKPTDNLKLSADVTLSRQLAEEAEQLRFLSLEELEELAAESDALIRRGLAKVHALKRGALDATVGPSRPSRQLLPPRPPSEPPVGD